MFRAAIYARRSQEQKDRAEEFKSVTRQVENARAFATKQGWTVAEDCIFIDDGISGTEFEGRPEFMRMMGLLRPRAPFQRLIVQEQKTIGREVAETLYTIKKITQAGVEIFEYTEGKSLKARGPMDKLMSSVQGLADEDHFVKTSSRMHEAHERLARAGHVAGGRKFGYRNRPVYAGEDSSGNPLRSHVEREVDPAEAAAVLRAFHLYDQGLGLRAVAKQLNAEGAARPKPFRRKPKLGGESPIAAWTCAHVRAVLRSEVYHGLIVWNRSRRRDDYGQRRPSRRDEKEVVRVQSEDLRIVPEDLWVRVQARRREVEGRTVRFDSGRLSGRPPKHDAPNLLAGLATCAVCGGGLGVDKGGKPKRRVYVYVCYQHHHTGTCPNGLRVPVDVMNEAVLQEIEQHALTPDAVEQVIRLTERDDVAERRARLEVEQKQVARSIERLVAAMEAAGEVVSVMDRVKKHEWRLKQITTEIAGLRPVPRLPATVVEDRLGEWRRLLRASTTQGRAVLQRIIRGRITFTPRADGTGYDFSAETRFDRLFSGVAQPVPDWMGQEMLERVAKGEPTGVGLENTSEVVEMIEADYSGLLAAVERSFRGIDPPGRIVTA